MNDAGSTNPVPTDVDLRLAFFKKLQEVTTKIHATNNLDEIMLDLGMEFCDLFHCDRFTLYAMDHEKDYIVSKVKTGLTTFRDLKLAVTPAASPAMWRSRARPSTSPTSTTMPNWRVCRRSCASSAASTSAPATAPARCWWRRW